MSLEWPVAPAGGLDQSYLSLSHEDGNVEHLENAPYLFFTALWSRQSQSVLMQVQQTDDIDVTCCKTLPTKSVTCLQVGPMSLEWPVALPAGPDQSCLSSSHEDPNDEHPEGALPRLPHLRWRRDALQPPGVQRTRSSRNTCVHIPDGGLRCVTWNTRIGSPASSQLSRKKKHIYLALDLPKTTTSYVFKKFRCRIMLTRLSARSFPSSWPGTAHFGSCLSVPPGTFDTLEAGTCAGSRAWNFSSSYFFL